jgi:hypothetical protein
VCDYLTHGAPPVVCRYDGYGSVNSSKRWTAAAGLPVRLGQLGGFGHPSLGHGLDDLAGAPVVRRHDLAGASGASDEPGHIWRSRWDSLTLFTPAQYDALPGMPFPGPPDTYPAKEQVADYLNAYAAEFNLPVRLNTRVTALIRTAEGFEDPDR